MNRAGLIWRCCLPSWLAILALAGSAGAGVIVPRLASEPADIDPCATVVGSAQSAGFKAVRSEGGVIVVTANAVTPRSMMMAPWPLGPGCTAADPSQGSKTKVPSTGDVLPFYSLTRRTDWSECEEQRTGITNDGTIRIGNPWEVTTGTAKVQIRRMRSEGPSTANLKTTIRYFLIKG
jgi:hypothetical protein